MHVYTVPQGVKCKLLVQEPNKDAEVKDDFVTRNVHDFSDEQLILDYVRFKNSGRPVTNLATKLASQGYYIFCKGKRNDKYLLAVHMMNVKVA